MNKEMDIKDMVPVKTSERHVILEDLHCWESALPTFRNFRFIPFKNRE